MAQTHGNGRELPLWERANADILEEFVRITEHDSGGTARTHGSRIRAQLNRFSVEHSYYPRLVDVVSDSELLAQVLACDRALDRPGVVSRGLLNGTRNSFASLVAGLPPPPGLSRDQLRSTLDRARGSSTETRGLRRVNRLGRPPEADERSVPTQRDVERVITALRTMANPVAAAVADVVAICYLTGLRVGAVLGLKRHDLIRLPDGRWWLLVQEKSRHDRRPVLVRIDRRALLGEWEGLPSGSSLWTVGGGRLTYRGALRLLDDACRGIRVDVFTFHRERHAFATDLAAFVGFQKMRIAGGWLAERVAEGYMHRRPDA